MSEFSNIKDYRNVGGNVSVAIHGKDEDCIVRFYEQEDVFLKDADPNSPIELMEAGDIKRVKAEYIEIQFPGNTLTKYVTRVEPSHKIRFARQYDAFKKGEQYKSEGHGLKETGFFSDQQIKDFEAKYIYTVEQFVSMPEHLMQGQLGGFSLKKSCEKWLADNKDKVVKESKEQTDAKIDALAAENKRMQETIDKLMKKQTKEG